MQQTYKDRFEKYILPEPNSGCWLWIGALDRDGYGRFAIYRGGDASRPQSLAAHRFSYELYATKIPDGMEIDHLCRNKCCVNPDHLEVVTVFENNKRKNSLKTHCPHGHSLDDAFLKKNKKGYIVRSCRECNRLYHIGYYYRNKKERAARWSP